MRETLYKSCNIILTVNEEADKPENTYRVWDRDRTVYFAHATLREARANVRDILIHKRERLLIEALNVERDLEQFNAKT